MVEIYGNVTVRQNQTSTGSMQNPLGSGAQRHDDEMRLK